jgi:hypothetical protein
MASQPGSACNMRRCRLLVALCMSIHWAVLTQGMARDTGLPILQLLPQSSMLAAYIKLLADYC